MQARSKQRLLEAKTKSKMNDIYQQKPRSLWCSEGIFAPTSVSESESESESELETNWPFLPIEWPWSKDNNRNQIEILKPKPDSWAQKPWAACKTKNNNEQMTLREWKDWLCFHFDFDFEFEFALLACFDSDFDFQSNTNQSNNNRANQIASITCHKA
jgi:hypothetical protein